MMKKRDDSTPQLLSSSSGATAIHQNVQMDTKPIIQTTATTLSGQTGVISMWPQNSANVGVDGQSTRIFVPTQHIVKPSNANVTFVQVLIWTQLIFSSILMFCSELQSFYWKFDRLPPAIKILCYILYILVIIDIQLIFI